MAPLGRPVALQVYGVLGPERHEGVRQRDPHRQRLTLRLDGRPGLLRSQRGGDLGCGPTEDVVSRQVRGVCVARHEAQPRGIRSQRLEKVQRRGAIAGSSEPRDDEERGILGQAHLVGAGIQQPLQLGEPLVREVGREHRCARARQAQAGHACELVLLEGASRERLPGSKATPNNLETDPGRQAEHWLPGPDAQVVAAHPVDDRQPGSDACIGTLPSCSVLVGRRRRERGSELAHGIRVVHGRLLGAGASWPRSGRRGRCCPCSLRV